MEDWLGTLLLGVNLGLAIGLYIRPETFEILMKAWGLWTPRD